MSAMILMVFAGLSLLYLSLQHIQYNIDQFIFHRLRSSVTHLLSGSRSLWLSGALASLILQATQIPIQMATTMRERRFFSTEQAFLFIVGATLGGSLKAWLFAANVQLYVSALLLLAGVVMLFWPGERYRFLARPLVGAACFWASLELIWLGAQPWLPELMASQFLAVMNVQGLLQEFALILFSIAIVTIFRSGTLPIFLVIQLVLVGVLTLETGAAMMLGINMGMGIQSIDKLLIKNSELRQLVWINAMNRILMGLILLIFLPYLLSFVSLVVPSAPGQVMEPFRVAAVHMLINVLMAMSGFFLFGLLQRVALWLAPDEEQEWRSLVLSKPVRRMLQSAPNYALSEIENQVQIALQQTKKLTDYNLRLLTEKHPRLHAMEQEMYLYETIEQSIYDLLLSLYDNPQIQSEPKYYQALDWALKTLDANSALYVHAYYLNNELSQGLSFHFYFIPEPLRVGLERFQNLFNELWLNIILAKPAEERLNQLMDLLAELDLRFESHIRPQIQSAELNIWLYRTLAMLRQESILLGELCAIHANQDLALEKRKVPHE